MLTFSIPAIVSLLLVADVASAADARPVQVMIVGSFHMENPGRDLHNLRADDVLSAKRQAEIAAVVDRIARFRPTVVAVEGNAHGTLQEYRRYLKGALTPLRSETVQLGFRLASDMHLATVHGIDVQSEFPYDAVEAYAKAHGQGEMLTDANAEIEAETKAETDLLARGTIADMLRRLNEPPRIAHDHAFYRGLLKIGGDTTQPGVDLLAAWYKRNFRICANLVQQIKPGDRVVVFYGAGHAFLLRQCVTEMPGYSLVEPADYLPR